MLFLIDIHRGKNKNDNLDVCIVLKCISEKKNETTNRYKRKTEQKEKNNCFVKITTPC